MSTAMPAARGTLLVEFARACKGAARAVSLYPEAHPSIQAALSRITAAAARLTSDADLTIRVRPDTLLIDDDVDAPPRQDQAIGELADLLHQRLVGEFVVARDAHAEDWRALLLLVAQSPDDLFRLGGIARSWAATGRTGFSIREIDYAEVLRERGGVGGAPQAADWDRIIQCCLQGDTTSIDERTLAALFDMPGDASRFAALFDRLDHGDAATGVSVSARAAALLHLLRATVQVADERGVASERVLQIMAEASARLTPETLLALLAERQSGRPEQAQMASALIERMNDGTIASFVAHSVVTERAATERLAYAFQALVPDVPRRDPLLALAHDEAQASELGQDAGFDQLWQSAAQMLTSYTDTKYVSDDYARELSGARTQAIEVDRVSDDPPERVHAWVATIAADAIRQLDLDLLLDLLRIEHGPGEWTTIADIALAEIDRRTLLGDLAGAHALTAALVHETSDEGRAALSTTAGAVIDRLASGTLVRHMALHLRKGGDDSAVVAGVSRLCHLIGPRLARPLAETLAVEQQPRAMRHLRELLLSFGAAGRQSVEQLKNSPNPAVRRTAIDLLRVFGGSDALPELASMLDDADPQVQRESIRAIVQIGTNDAYAVLERALVAGSASRDNLVQQLIGLRDDKAIPLLCYVLNHTRARGQLVRVHIDIMEALSGLGDHRDATRTLGEALLRGDWWAPRRTAALRATAAAALRRINSPAAQAMLDEAATRGGRGVRTAVAAVRPRARR